MMAYVFLDSTFVIDYLRGDPTANSRLARAFEEGEQPMVNEIVACEVRAGLHPADAPAFQALMEPTEFVQPGPESAVRAGEWRSDARARGHTLSLGDALIAAAAEAADATVLTRNVRDFALTPVRVESY
jgi:predicted nucleic acid-binding protein